jgi:hypothetical protein
VRFLGSNGPEAAGRLATFTYVPISIIAALALVHAVRIVRQPAPAAPAGRAVAYRVVAGSALITLLMGGRLAAGRVAVAGPVPGQCLRAVG